MDLFLSIGETQLIIRKDSWAHQTYNSNHQDFGHEYDYRFYRKKGHAPIQRGSRTQHHGGRKERHVRIFFGRHIHALEFFLGVHAQVMESFHSLRVCLDFSREKTGCHSAYGSRTVQCTSMWAATLRGNNQPHHKISPYDTPYDERKVTPLNNESGDYILK